jgi:multiple sugar transport system ATP-binding protein
VAILDLDRVTKLYPGAHEPAVDAVTMSIADGEIVALLGSSGCGKTSTLRMVAGFESVTEGTIRLGDRVINSARPADRNIAMAFEGYALYPPLKVWDNIAFSLLRDRTPKAEIDRRVTAISDMLELGPMLQRFPPSLSGGQQQRVSLARALIRKAAIYLLDEPMSQLEPQLRAILRARIKDYLIDRRMTTVFVTHDQTEAVALADRIAVMDGGKLQQLGSPAALRDTPANLFVASFIGEPPMNLFPARVERTEQAARISVGDPARPDFVVSVALDRVPPESRGVLHRLRDVYLGVRPNRIRIGAPDQSGDPALTGPVLFNQWLGDQSHVGVALGSRTLIAVADGELAAPVDSSVTVMLPLDALHLFDRTTERAVLHGMRPAEAFAEAVAA